MARSVALKRLYPAIGEFVIQYAIVQGTLRTLLLTLLGVKGKGATTLVYGMSDEVVAKKLKIALRAFGKNYTKFQPAIDALNEVARFRNQIVHWVPFTNPSRTSMMAWVDAHRDYKNPTQPQIECTPHELRDLVKWLRIFEWDVLSILMSLESRERFDDERCVTIDPGYQPKVPKSQYPSV